MKLVDRRAVDSRKDPDVAGIGLGAVRRTLARHEDVAHAVEVEVPGHEDARTVQDDPASRPIWRDVLPKQRLTRRDGGDRDRGARRDDSSLELHVPAAILHPRRVAIRGSDDYDSPRGWGPNCCFSARAAPRRKRRRTRSRMRSGGSRRAGRRRSSTPANAVDLLVDARGSHAVTFAPTPSSAKRRARSPRRSSTS